MRRVLILGSILLALPGAGARADDCRFEEMRASDLAVGAASAVEIEAGAGFLRVQGSPGVGTVSATAQLCADDAEDLERAVFEIYEKRGVIVVEGKAERSRRSWDGSNLRVNLTVTVPAELAISIDDGSGETEVRGVHSLRMNDGSGAILIEDVASDVAVTDGSGELRIARVGGRVEVTDGSGEIEIRDAGSVEIAADGSGEIDIAQVAGDVIVGADGSGSIRVEDVGGDFEVGSDGSGGVRYDYVRGRVRVPRDDW